MTWNVDSLKEYFESILTEKDKALIAALVAVKEENRKTEVAAEKRFDLLNELRDGVATKGQLEALEKVVSTLNDRMNRDEGSSSGSQLTKTNFYAALVAVAAAVSVVVLFANHIFK